MTLRSHSNSPLNLIRLLDLLFSQTAVVSFNMIPSNYGSVQAEGFANPDSENRQLGTLTAQSCFEKDFMAQSSKTGNFIQRTNNFRHEEPDNCSAPLTEFVRA